MGFCLFTCTFISNAIVKITLCNYKYKEYIYAIKYIIMSKVALTINNYSSAELKSLIRKDEKFQQAIKLFACYQVSLGKRPKDLEGIYETSFKSICNWIHKLNEGGVEALVDKEKPGRSKRLSDEQLQEIRNILLEKSPEDYEFNSSTWTGPLLIELIKSRYEVDYKKAQIYNIIHKLGLTYTKGKGIYPESKDRDPKVDE
jgi:transposase